MSAELFHVIASVIRRHTQGGRSIPLLSRFDPHDKVWSAQLPFLFQRRIGSTDRVISSGTVLNMIKRRCDALAEKHPGFRRTRFTPHDFRRIFATELVNSGLPIHIGAALLGHLNIQTTRGYVAVFDEDIVRHYVAFLDHRRELRPIEEYREATSEEWAEFDEHFDKRKVELGSCGRPYGTPCQHEHVPLTDAARQPQDARPPRRTRSRSARPPDPRRSRELGRRNRRHRYDPHLPASQTR